MLCFFFRTFKTIKVKSWYIYSILTYRFNSLVKLIFVMYCFFLRGEPPMYVIIAYELIFIWLYFAHTLLLWLSSFRLLWSCYLCMTLNERNTHFTRCPDGLDRRVIFTNSLICCDQMVDDLLVTCFRSHLLLLVIKQFSLNSSLFNAIIYAIEVAHIVMSLNFWWPVSSPCVLSENMIVVINDGFFSINCERACILFHFLDHHYLVSLALGTQVYIITCIA